MSTLIAFLFYCIIFTHSPFAQAYKHTLDDFLKINQREAKSCIVEKSDSSNLCRFEKGKILKIQKSIDQYESRRLIIQSSHLVIAWENEQTKLMNQCLDKRFNECHPKLEKAISKNKLNDLFEKLIHNPVYRMNTPEVSCYQRARLLTEELAKAGIKSKLLQIMDAPTLIAVNIDRNGKANGWYNDYHGQHWIVSVEVKNGIKIEEKVLDPQFFSTPISRKEYFNSVIGQDCNEFSPAQKLSKWQCSYSYRTPSFVTITNYLQLKTLLADDQECDSHFLSNLRVEIAAINQWSFSTSDKVSKELEKDPQLREKLILNAYQELKKNNPTDPDADSTLSKVKHNLSIP